MKITTALLSLLTVHLTSSSPLSFPLTTRDLTADTQNDLVDGSPCKDLLVIFARGTDSSGNVGTSTGPPFFQAIANLTGTDALAVQGVDYGATIDEFLEGGDPIGSALMATLVEQAFAQCPSSKVVMSGYSQGGQIVHNAASMLNATISAKISSVLIFGDPDNGTAVGSIAASKVDVICHSGDDICLHGILVLPAHLDYSENAGEAAAFVVGKAGL